MHTEKAYAKVNLSLEIYGIKPDGYHLIDTFMQSVSLFDVINLEKEENGIKVICSDNSIKEEKNICYKAAKLFFEKSKIEGGAKIEIIKNIPVAAGLGGGSTDCAAVLRALNNAYNKVLSNKQLKEMALSLGADVPFCIDGKSAVVKGIGEKIKPVSRNLDYFLILVKDDYKPSTGQMYKKLDSCGYIEYKSATDNIASSYETQDYNKFCKNLINHFSAVWDYSKIKKELLNCGADGVSLSGSGPTVFGIFKNEEKALKCFEIIKEKYKNSYLCRPVD